MQFMAINRTKGLLLGITGIIGSGKSYASKVFEELGAIRISSDEIAFSLSNLNSSIGPALQDLLGKEAFLEDGSLDRKYVAKLIFNDLNQKKSLEAIIHPAVRQKMRENWENTKPEQVVAWEVPLLFETDAHTLCDVTLCITTDITLAKNRCKERSGLKTEEFYARSESQLSQEEKASRADFQIQNFSGLTEFKNKLQSFFNGDLKERLA